MRSEIERLLNLWEKLSESAHAAVHVKLAALASPSLEDGGPFDVDPEALDIGEALKSLLEEGRGYAGRKSRLPGVEAGVREAVEIWKARHPRQPVEVGQLRREKKGGDNHHPYPLLSFVVDAMEIALSREELVSVTGMKHPERKDVERAFDSHLRALRQSRQI